MASIRTLRRDKMLYDFEVLAKIRVVTNHQKEDANDLKFADIIHC